MGLTSPRPVTPLTRSERQDELVKMIPAGGFVIRRPNTNPDGSDIVCRTDYEFPSRNYDQYVKEFCEAMQSGADWQVNIARDMMQDFCCIDGPATSR